MAEVSAYAGFASLRRLLAASDYVPMQGWELSALFMFFLIITLVWDLLVGMLTFLNNILRGRKANWLTRVKEELLALGVVSLVLLFVEPTLQQICIPTKAADPDPNPSPPAPVSAPLPYGTYSCPSNSRQVFPRSVIHAAHYLLFYLAIVHILFSLLTSVITNVKLSKWSALERTARKEQNIPAVAHIRIATAVTRSEEVNPRLVMRIREVWRDLCGYVDQDLYSLLRFMCEKRFRAHHVILRNFNFLNMCEQCLEAELNEVYSHAWLLVFMMALLLLYNRLIYQMVWITMLCICSMGLMAGNLRWVMKKAAREARDLWRKIQGLGGGEQEGGPDDYVEGEEGSARDGEDGEGGEAAKLVKAGGAAAKSGDLEAGDVALQRKLDQLRQQHGGPTQAGGAARNMRYAPQPVGEATEAASALGPAAANAAVSSVAPASPTRAACSPRSRASVAPLDPDPRVAAAGDTSPVAETCADAERGASVSRQPWRAGSSTNSGIAVDRDRGSGCTTSSRKAQALASAYATQLELVPRPRMLVDLVEAGKAARRSATSQLHVHLKSFSCKGGAAAALASKPAPLFRRLGRGAGCAGSAAEAGTDAVGDSRVVSCSGRGGARLGLGPGPVAEGTVTNPLYGAAVGGAAGAGGGGGGGFMYGGGGQMQMHPQMYGRMGGGGGGVMMQQQQQIQMQQEMQMRQQQQLLAQQQRQWGMGVGSAGMPASSPYGSTAVTANNGVAAAVSAVTTAGTGAGAPAGDGQWGSNPSSGQEEGQEGQEEGPEEAAVDGLSSSESGSTTSSERKKRDEEHELDNDSDKHSERSMIEHELATGIEDKIIRLFFFGKPYLLLWIFNVIFAQASLTMTMSMAFVIPYDKFDSIRDVAQPMYVWLPVVLINFLLVFYGCWVFLPQYALLSVTGVMEPHEVMAEIKRSKTQDESEEGVAAVVLDKLTHYFVGKHDGETNLSTAFIVSLASQAGIILGRDYKANKHINKTTLKVMYKELMMVWHDIAWYGELTSTYKLKTQSQVFEEAFKELDEDGSGALSFGELANMIRSLGTYATAGDVEAMLWEIDIDNSHSIGYDEFVKFITYAFFDTKQLGYIDTEALMDGMERLALPINEMQAAVLMAVGHCEPGEEVKVTLRQFFEMYEKVSFGDEEPGSEEGGSTKDSILGRAWQVLRTPSMMILGLVKRDGSNASAIKRESSVRSLLKVPSSQLLQRTASGTSVLRAQGSSGLQLSPQRSGVSGASGMAGSVTGGGVGGMRSQGMGGQGMGSMGMGSIAMGNMGMGIGMEMGIGSMSGGSGAGFGGEGGSMMGGGGAGAGGMASAPSVAGLKGPSRLAVMSRPEH